MDKRKPVVQFDEAFTFDDSTKLHTILPNLEPFDEEIPTDPEAGDHGPQHTHR